MDLLSDILSCLRLSGTLYFRTSFTSPWSIKVPAFENVSRFHYAHQGRCLVRIDPQAPPVQLDQGDLLIIPRGASHTMYCDPATENLAVTLDRVVEKSGFTGSGTLVYGEPGTHHETQLVCGHFAFDDAASHLLIDALPEHIHIRDYGEAAGQWMASTLRVIGTEAGRAQMGGDLIALKLSEIIFAQALRAYLTGEGKQHPVMAGFADPQIARVLMEIHRDPAHGWTLEALAQIAGMSRTAFTVRFSELMTVTPLSYVTDWRMQLARQALRHSNTPIVEIAQAAGYGSEAAFSRAFKRHCKMAPGSFRRQVQGPEH